MFQKILIANRGEIACRVAATARRMGIASVAVYSDADANARHVQLCDEAIHIGPSSAKESYLQIERIIDAALRSGAQAIHPGYGFLSENLAFAQACSDAGLTFIGPPASAIAAMGSKSEAKALMAKAGVPLVPGYHGSEQGAAFLQARADEIGYPVLLKASAGGGGKGMRVVDRARDFAAALQSCQREAQSSFGDARVLIEKYLTAPRHIEIQIFADTHGNTVHLFERDCSVQRRHQKVLEEAPAPGMTTARRDAMGQAAIDAAKAVGYVGAGTVEFIAEQDGSFYFMEMNTRLQVEHPVTEMITGLDLVEWQLRVAAGEALPLQQNALAIDGHAIEARIYAENPEAGFLPSIGTLRHFSTPRAVEFQTGQTGASPTAVRIDAGVMTGAEITPYYDPMIAKLIVWGANRNAALARMHAALSEVQIVGVASNVAFLQRLVQCDAFAQAQLDTGLIEKNHAALFPLPTSPEAKPVAFAIAALLAAEQAAMAAGDPWSMRNGWRLASRANRRFSFQIGERAVRCQIQYCDEGFELHWQDRVHTIGAIKWTPPQCQLVLDDETLHATVISEHSRLHVFCAGTHTVTQYQDQLALADHDEQLAGGLTAPMPGKVIACIASDGVRVSRGAPLLILEAMKMEHTITAPADGVVERILFEVGEQVSEGAALVEFKAE